MGEDILDQSALIPSLNKVRNNAQFCEWLQAHIPETTTNDVVTITTNGRVRDTVDRCRVVLGGHLYVLMQKDGHPVSVRKELAHMHIQK